MSNNRGFFKNFVSLSVLSERLNKEPGVLSRLIHKLHPLLNYKYDSNSRLYIHKNDVERICFIYILLDSGFTLEEVMDHYTDEYQELNTIEQLG